METLTFEQLEVAILRYMSKIATSHFSPTYDYFWMLYRYGFRAEEIRSLTNWVVVENGSIQVPTAKGGNIRTIVAEDLPASVIRSLSSGVNEFAVFGYDAFRKQFQKDPYFSKCRIGRKKCGLHVFRHYRIKKMWNDGLSISEIKTETGLKNDSVVQGYIFSQIKKF